MNQSCPQCGHSELKTSEVELRKVDPKNNKVIFTQNLLEGECDSCGWTGTL